MSFCFTRKYTIENILKPKNIVLPGSILEYSTFDDFEKYQKIFNEIDLDIIIPLLKVEEIESLKKYLKNLKKTKSKIFLYLKNISFEILESLFLLEGNSSFFILCDCEKVIDLYNILLQTPCKNFYKVCKNIQGVFRGVITKDTLENIPFLYGEPFKIFPFFCNAWIEWDYKSFEDFPVGQLEELLFYLRFVYFNYVNSSYPVNWGTFTSSSENSTITYSYKFLQKKTLHTYFVEKDFLFLDRNKEDSYKLNINSLLESNGNSLDNSFVNQIKSAYLATSFVREHSLEGTFFPEVSFLSASQNLKCTNNPVMYPIIAALVSKVLLTGNLK